MMRVPLALLMSLLAVALLPAAPDTHRISVSPPPGASSMRAFVDPETGRLRAPTAEERRELARQRARVTLEETPVEIERRDGMRFARVPPERNVHLRAEIDREGNVRLVHDGGDHE